MFGEYLSVNVRTLSPKKNTNRLHILPARGRIGTEILKLNIRNRLSHQDSEALDQLASGTPFTAYELFAGENADWYKIRTDSGLEGWVSGKYIDIEY